MTNKRSEKTYYKRINSPLGPITLTATDTHLIAVSWGRSAGKKPDGELSDDHPVLSSAEVQLTEYFEGKRKTFDLPLQAKGTPFQEKVWNALRRIPYGETWSYGKLAKIIRNPKACRAVGAANGKNPLGIIVPCHRVIGTSGDLTGFASGLKSKAALLNLEKLVDPSGLNQRR